jgi:putative DNA primase/helicase
MKKLSEQELEQKIKSLVGVEKWYYDFLPDECWMSEDRQVKALQDKGIDIGRTKLRRVKKKLISEGLIILETQPNGKRKNLKHKLLKAFPIRETIGRRQTAPSTTLEDRAVELERYVLEEGDYTFTAEINWSLLQSFTAQDLNKMDRLEKIQLYMDCGFIVLPTHYPVFTENSVECSCKRKRNCQQVGKHPVHRYNYFDSIIYEKKKDFYLKQFKDNPNLNVGFKVMGFSVLDVDFRHDGDKTLAGLLQESETDFNHAISVKTGGGGVHIYASNTDLKNTAGVLGSGIDIRSEGGFIVAPGSRHKSRTVYEWQEIGEPALMPEDWFYSNSEENEQSSEKKPSIKKDGVAGRQLKDIILPAQPTSDYIIREGVRELTLFKWACLERGKGANAEQIYDILITIRDTYCEAGDEPVTDEEVRDIATAASRYRTEAEKKLVG